MIKKILYNNNFKKEICEICNIGPIYNNKHLSLQLDHINGDNKDNRIENLRILCPCCHSQTDTFCKSKTKSIKHTCVNCDKIIQKTSKRCIDCYKLKTYKLKTHKPKTANCIDCKTPIKKTSKRCVKCHYLSRKNTNKPSKEQLRKDLETLSYVKVGKKYNVSDNCIRKWLK